MTPEVPTGARCFIDANILVYHFVEHPTFSLPCEHLMNRIERGEIEGFSSPMAAAEAIHRIMLLEVQSRFATAKPLAYVQRRPHIIADLMLYRQSAQALTRLPLKYLPVDANLFASTTETAAAERLLTDDASIVALMRRDGIRYLASNDSEFDNVGGITVCRPR
jgi:predicted nucleic acid-binding protein